MNKYEFYYNQDTIDVKGIDDILLERHRGYMLEFLAGFFKANEISPSKKYPIDYLTEFIRVYRSRELDIDYYRELNNQSLLRITDLSLFGNVIGAVDVGRSEMHRVHIGYNLERYLIPLISILV